jgi:hypothetical protein
MTASREEDLATREIQHNVDGNTHVITADPEMPLLYALRNDLGLRNPRFGCGLVQVQFDDKNVTSVDWETYPILDITETPETIDVVLIDHKELPPSGAGEPSMRPVAAAIANAIFDATGVRIRQAPFTPDKLKAAGLA